MQKSELFSQMNILSFFQQAFVGEQVFNIHGHSIVQQIFRMYLPCPTETLYRLPSYLLIWLKTFFLHMVENSTFNSYQKKMTKLGSSQISKSQGKVWLYFTQIISDNILCTSQLWYCIICIVYCYKDFVLEYHCVFMYYIYVSIVIHVFF